MDNQEYIYKEIGTRALRLLLLPPTEKKFDRSPVYFTVTGGGWAQSVKEDIIWFTQPGPDDARAAGYTVISPEYRLRSETDMVGMVSDVMDAARFAVKNADMLGIDPEKIAFCGHSAGSHLALMAAWADQSAFRKDSPFPEVTYRPACCMGYATPAILFSESGKAAPIGENLVEAVFGESAADNDLLRRMSPISYIRPGSCPSFLIHGSADPVIGYENALRVVEVCKNAGVACELLTVKGGGHSFETMDESQSATPDAKGAYGEVKHFTKKYLG